MDIVVTGLSPFGGGPARNGSRVLAHFDFDLAGLRLYRCALVRSPEDHLLIWSPISVVKGRGATLTFLDDRLRVSVIQAAWRAYQVKIGRELDWAPVDRPGSRKRRGARCRTSGGARRQISFTQGPVSH